MEDNEFEEVTIISHTDHGTSVLPQSTAERLMKEIKLEVTQKITQNENVKLGSLQHSTTPTLLDSIYQNVLSKFSYPDSLHFLSPYPSLPDSHTSYLLATMTHMLVHFDTGTKSQAFRLVHDKKDSPFYILPWGDLFYTFVHGGRVLMHDSLGTQVASSTQCYFGTPGGQVHSNSKMLCFLTQSSVYCFHAEDPRTDVKLPTVGGVTDFVICSRTNLLCTLTSTGALQRGTSLKLINKEGLSKFRVFQVLKQMYSGHFLVVSKATQSKLISVHLVEYKGCLF